jgi:uncharacterized membrane protein
MKNHEAFVHFPIALLLSAFLFALIGLFYRRGLFKEMVFWNLMIGLLATTAAIYSGAIEQEQITDRHLREELDLHARNAYTMGILLTIITVWMGIRKRNMKTMEYLAWLSLFFVASASVGYQGFKGHEMAAKMQEHEIQASRPMPAPKVLDYGWNF